MNYVSYVTYFGNVFFIFIGNINPLSPHEALKHHFTSLKTDLIFLQSMVLEGIFP